MGKCICPLSCSVLYNFLHDVVKRGWAMGMHPLPSPAWADFTLMIKCMPESGHCHSVYSVMFTTGGGVKFILFIYLHTIQSFEGGLCHCVQTLLVSQYVCRTVKDCTLSLSL